MTTATAKKTSNRRSYEADLHPVDLCDLPLAADTLRRLSKDAQYEVLRALLHDGVIHEEDTLPMYANYCGFWDR